MSTSKLRTPDPIYFKHGVIQFSQKDQELYYEVWVWTEDGLNKFKYSNKIKLQTDELEVLRKMTHQDEVFRHLNAKVSND